MSEKIVDIKDAKEKTVGEAKDKKKAMIDNVQKRLAEKDLYLDGEQIDALTTEISDETAKMLEAIDKWTKFFQKPNSIDKMAKANMNLMDLTQGIQQMMNIQEGLIQVSQWYAMQRLVLEASPKIVGLGNEDIIV